jgi:polar amino acid transport system substrate-binding protein
VLGSQFAKADDATPGVIPDPALAATVPTYYRDRGTLVVAVNPDVAPIKFVDDAGEITGFTPDLVKAAATTLNLKVLLSRTSFDALIPGLAAGRFDFILSLSDFASRHKIVTFIDYLNMGETVVTAPAKHITLTSINDMCGLSVAVVRGTAAMQKAIALSDTCEKSARKPVAVSTYPDGNMALLSVSSQASDAAWIDSPVGYYNQSKFPERYKVSYFTPVAPYGIGFGVDEKSRQLTSAFQKALLKLERTGVYGALLKKWGISPKDAKPLFPINGAEL